MGIDAAEYVGAGADHAASASASELDILRRTSEIQRLRIAELESIVASMGKELAMLKKVIAAAQYGRRSERDAAGQLALPLDDDLVGAQAAGAPGGGAGATEGGESESKEGRKRSRKHLGRNPIPALLPRESVVHALTKEELDARFGEGQWREIGEEIKEELDYRASSLFVVRHVVKKYAALDGFSAPVRAELPPAVIPKGRPGPGLLAHLVVSKYADHLPLYRIEGILGRQGVDLPRSTMCFWLAQVSFLLCRLMVTIKQQILATGVVRSDDTPVCVLDRSAPSGSRKGYIWPYMSYDGQIVFDFTDTHSGKHPRAFLGDYHGYFQADAANLYDRLFRGSEIVEVGCFAHARRAYFKAKDTDPGLAAEALAMIRALYAIEADAKARNLRYEEVRVLRQEKALPILNDIIKPWVDANLPKVLPASQLGKALSYTNNHWEALKRYTEDGRLSIDNNDVEREIRQVAIGRRNWLFFAGPQGSQTAMVLYTLVANCKLEGIDPFAYFCDLLTRLPTLSSEELATLTPRRWKMLREGAALPRGP